MGNPFEYFKFFFLSLIMGGCCSETLDPRWYQPCYKRRDVIIMLKIFDGENTKELERQLFQLKKGTEIPWGTEIKCRDDLRQWLCAHFEDHLWPLLIGIWRGMWPNEKVFKRETPAEIYDIEVSFNNAKYLSIKTSDWVSDDGNAREKRVATRSELEVFYFVLDGR